MGIRHSSNDNKEITEKSINLVNITDYVKPLESMITNIDDINDDDKIWNMLLSKGLFSKTHEYANKLYAIKICQNDVHYVKENYKYIENKGMLTNFVVLAATFCIDIEIIKFLIYKRASTATHATINECLYYALAFNPSLKMIRYLIEIMKANVDILLQHMNVFRDTKLHFGTNRNYETDSYSCFDLVFSGQYNSNFIEKAKYLIEDTNIFIRLRPEYIGKFKQIIVFIKKNVKLNMLLREGLKIYSFNEMKSVIQMLNPLMVEKEFRDLLGIYPFQNNYNIFCNDINMIECKKLLEEIKNEGYLLYKQMTEYKQSDVNVTGSEILFKCNGIDYKGDREIVYNVMYPLKNISKNADFSDTIVLGKSLPDYIVKKYIESCYTNKFNIDNIESTDMIQFIEFIDQYPTNLLTLSNFEIDIVKYFEKYKIPCTQYMKDLCDRYQLKLMYLFIKINQLSIM